jgi:hypothetical protein
MSSPIACRLDLLSPAERELEQRLLARARAALGAPEETAAGYRFAVPEHELAALGELLGLERRCCPFLAFALELEAEQGGIFLHIHGRPGVKPFIASVFGRDLP